jgi:hypothetical protein
MDAFGGDDMVLEPNELSSALECHPDFSGEYVERLQVRQ